MTLLLLVWNFFQIGAFSIGGGYAMIPLIQKLIVANGWLTVQEVADVVAISQMTPGPFAINAATFVGMRVSGVVGAICCTVGVTLPSVIIVLIIAKFFFNFQHVPGVRYVLYGIRPVVMALIATSIVTIAQTALFIPEVTLTLQNILQAVDWKAVALCVVSRIAMVKFKVDPVIMIVISAAAGILIYAVL